MFSGYLPWRAFSIAGHADVGSENLYWKGAAGLVLVFSDRDRDRECLFSGGAARHPDANRFVRRPSLEDAREYNALEVFERFAIAKKTRHTDKQIPLQRRQLAGIFLQKFAVVREAIDIAQGETPQDAALDHLLPVHRKIDSGGRAQNRQNAGVETLRP